MHWSVYIFECIVQFLVSRFLYYSFVNFIQGRLQDADHSQNSMNNYTFDFRFNHFWHYLLDLHNLKVEGRVKIVANPLTSQRLTLILEEMALEDEMENVSLEDDIISEDEDNLVTTIYYEESNCEWSRRAKCKTKSCACYRTDQTCSEKCFCGTNCTNKC